MTDLDLLHLRRRVDRVLGDWDRSDTPGVTLGVVRDNQLVVHRSAGMASLELGVPIGSATTFRIASVSKQITCTAIPVQNSARVAGRRRPAGPRACTAAPDRRHPAA